MRSETQRVLRWFGYEFRKVRKFGADPIADVKKLTVAPDSPVIFDVGANVGHFISELLRDFPSPTIHAFEPSPSTYSLLKERWAPYPNIFLNELALGSRPENRVLIESSLSDMTSLLEPGTQCWGEVLARRSVAVSTIDSYAERAGVHRINLLKIDTQGFDLEVMRGGKEMLRRRAIEFVFVEITFADLYSGQATLPQVFEFLIGNGFSLVAFYGMNFVEDKAGWTDALFINSMYEKSGRS